MSIPLTLAEEVFRIAKSCPDEIAFEELGGDRVSYRELWLAASAFARQMETLDHSTRVALCFPKGLAFISSLLGAWSQGMTPVILDPDWPLERRNQIMSDAEVSLVLQDLSSEQSSAVTPKSFSPETPAYVIYSSGSTGKPKGVLVPHAGLVSMLSQQVEAFRMSVNTRSLWMHGVAFDASISDVGTALLSGATLCLGNSVDQFSPRDFLRYVERSQISHIDIPPSLLSILNANEAPLCLKSLVIGGSVCPPDQVRAWASQVHLVNVYGPTEATVCSSMIACGTDWDEPLIGNAIEGISYHVENDELIISGEGVAFRYLNQEALSAQKFFLSEGVRSFKTGDRVRENAQGQLVFIGRLDRQFKKQGKLISPEEVEARICQHCDIHEAYVSLDGVNLRAWIQTDLDEPPSDLRSQLQKDLPVWMIPTHWLVVDQMPRLASGKVDAEMLKEICRSKEAKTPSESLILETMREILNFPDFGIDDDFFGAGADSLAAMRFLAAMDAKGIYLTPDGLHRHRTARLLSAHYGLADGYERSSDELLTEVSLATKRLIPVSADRVQREHISHLLLTGSTGFLGSAILGEMLSRSEMPVTCLVRGNVDEAEALIRRKLSYHGYNGGRFELMQGELTEPQFGLSDNDWIALSNKCSHIVHSAAALNSLASYDDLYDANVKGTETILNLQRTGRAKKLSYISTLSVFVDATPLPEVCLESDFLDLNTQVYGGYAQTKWVAEKLVRRSSVDTMGVTHILRLGLLTGSAKTAYSASNDGFTRKLLGEDYFLDSSCLPSGASLDVTPVDYAAKTVVDTLLSDVESQTFHLANPQQLSATELYQAVDQSDLNPVFSQSSQYPALFKSTGTHFSTENTQSIQSTECPVPTQDFLISLFNRIFTAS